MVQILEKKKSKIVKCFVCGCGLVACVSALSWWLCWSDQSFRTIWTNLDYYEADTGLRPKLRWIQDHRDQSCDVDLSYCSLHGKASQLSYEWRQKCTRLEKIMWCMKHRISSKQHAYSQVLIFCTSDVSLCTVPFLSFCDHTYSIRTDFGSWLRKTCDYSLKSMC